MRNRTAEWQVFPASIHFRCDKNGSCTLTRANSHVTLQARLLKSRKTGNREQGTGNRNKL
jgi:hypothetical protein